MSQAMSPSASKTYGIERVCAVWNLSRATVQRHKAALGSVPKKPAKRGPRCVLSDDEILAAIRRVLAESPFVGEGYRKIWARLRHHHSVRAGPKRVLKILRENHLLAHERSTVVRGPKVHDGTIVTERPDEMWAIDATAALTEEGDATVFIVVDHCTGECLGTRAARRGTRFEAIDTLRQAIWTTKGRYAEDVADGVALRHDHGSQFISYAFQEELRFVGIRSSPAFVRQPEGNGCAERFIRTLKEQLLWLRRFPSVDELDAALKDFAQRYNNRWIIGRLGYRTPAQHRRILLGEAA